MVVFTCNYCGESLQKPKVEKHYNFVCRKVKNLTCVDCFKDFRGEDYAVHIKCCTEEERYAAKGTHPNGIVKKGDVKQESWLNQVRSIIDEETNLKPALLDLLNTISQYNNIPRKKKKFINFLVNSMGRRVNVNDIEAAWDIIEKHTNNAAMKPVATEDNQAEVLTSQMNGQLKTEEVDCEDKADINDKVMNSKKKKQKLAIENGDSFSNTEIDKKNNDESVGSKKKKRKQKVDSSPVESQDIANNQIIENEKKESQNKTNHNDAEINQDNPTKKKRKQKMQAEDIISPIESQDIVPAVQIKVNKKKKPKQEIKNGDDYNNIKTDQENDKSLDSQKRKHEMENGGTSRVEIDQLNNKESLNITPTTEIADAKKKKKRKNNVEDNISESPTKIQKTEECQISDKFNIKATVISILERKGSITLKKLEKNLISAYKKQCGEGDSLESVVKKFHKKLRKMPLDIADDQVSLKQA